MSGLKIEIFYTDLYGKRYTSILPYITEKCTERVFDLNSNF